MSKSQRFLPHQVSDDALLRWIQRRYGFDVEAERRKIDKLTDTAVRIGAKTVKVEGVQFIIRGGRVVTTLEPGMKSFDDAVREARA